MNYSFCIKTIMDAANRYKPGKRQEDLFTVQSSIEKKFLEKLNSVDIGEFKEALEMNGYNLNGFVGSFVNICDFGYLDEEIIEFIVEDEAGNEFSIPAELIDED